MSRVKSSDLVRVLMVPCFCLLVFAVCAQRTGRNYETHTITAVKAQGEVVVDGRIWEWADAETMRLDDQAGVPDPNQVKIYTLWDENYLYIAYQVKDVIDSMIMDTGIAPSELRADGGPTRNRFLMQFQSDILDTVISTSDIEELSAKGCAMMAGLAVGMWKDRRRKRKCKRTVVVVSN